MTATNHALTGALIGLAIHNPPLAIALAFISHFVCDTIPHFGPADEARWIVSRTFRIMLTIDCLLCVTLVIVLATVQPSGWLLASVCAFIATSPDIAWLPGYLSARRTHRQPKRTSWFTRFAGAIQWFAKPSGAIVEAVWASAAIVLLSRLLQAM